MDYYDKEQMKWVSKKQIPQADCIKKICICWLSECKCQFQRHTNAFTLCESFEIFRLCSDHKDINYGDEF